MSLETYRQKRDFERTPEPDGAAPDQRRAPRRRPPPAGERFVVQRHRATRLHYDLRLEIGGVLVSWAVPRGPSLDPAAKRMAVHVEDHPLEYFDFEGVIPRGQYGGGDVIVWDWGTFEPEETDDPAKAVRDGELKFRVQGEKLRGRFTLVRTGGRNDDKDGWLLIHKRDEAAEAGWDAESHPRSVKSGRTNDEVKEGRPELWDVHAPAAEATIDLRGSARAPMPDFIPPMQATAVASPFSDPDWLFELKLDGYRVEAVVTDGQVRLWTRNKQDAARYFPDLAEGRPSWIDARRAIVDGEVVALDPGGRPSFSALQDRTGMRGLASKRGERHPSRKSSLSETGAPLVYYVFDLLHLDDQSLLDVPLEQRKRLLRSLMRDHPTVRYLSHVEADGEDFLEAARRQGLEGAVAKLRQSRYEPDHRARSWLKLKVRRDQELIVAGYQPGQGTHADLGSLIVGTYDERGHLVFAGHVGSGIDTRTRRDLARRLDDLRTDDPPFHDIPRIPGARWVKPSIVIRAEFAEWTTDGLLRQATYKGEEISRDPRSVRREVDVATAPAVEAAERSALKKTAGSEEGLDRTKGRRPRARLRPGAEGLSDGGAAGDDDDGRPSGPADRASDRELAALDELGTGGQWDVGGHRVVLSNLDKVLFPGPDYTKRDLIRYYVSISPTLLPYLRNRPLNVDRWPNGVEGKHFWQKQIPDHAPAWVARWDYPEAGSTESHTYVVADRVATIAWLANQAVIDLHPWTSTCDAYRTPTYALIDIDPGESTTFDQVVAFARLYHAALEHLGLTGFPKVTGKRGIQIWVPVRRRYTFDETREWVGELSMAIGRAVPDQVSWEWGKADRQGLARLDFTQNAVNKTLVAPYAVRPVRNGAVSTPITWAELDDPSLRPDGWDMRAVLQRVATIRDPFAGVLEMQQELPRL